MWIIFLELLHKPIIRKSHGNFQITAWNPKFWDFTLLFVFSFLRKRGQVTYPLSPFLFFNMNWPLPPSSLQWPMHCSKDISSTWKWYKKKNSAAWKIITGNHVTIPVRSTGTEWTACAAETQSHQVEHFTLRYFGMFREHVTRKMQFSSIWFLHPNLCPAIPDAF